VQHVHARIYPTQKVTMTDGTVEMLFEILIEQSDEDATMPKLVSPESARVTR
jgi:hypothetical protein